MDDPFPKANNKIIEFFNPLQANALLYFNAFPFSTPGSTKVEWRTGPAWIDEDLLSVFKDFSPNIKFLGQFQVTNSDTRIKTGPDSLCLHSPSC